MRRILGFDLGGTKLLACMTDGNGVVIGQTVRPTGRHTGPATACHLMISAADELRHAYGDAEGAGIGFPGVVDFPEGIARSSIMLDGWREFPIARRASEALGIPCVIDNDVNAAAVAELKARAVERPASMLFVAVGTGIGGALTFGNQLWRGHTGVAGEIGNMTIDRYGARCWCGRRGCLNTCASGAAIAQTTGAPDVSGGAGRASGLSPATRAAAEALGVGIANALNLLNPGLVVLGGGVARNGSAWLDVVATTARAEAFREAAQCRFELARSGYAAGAIGAALLAAEANAANRTPPRMHDQNVGDLSGATP